MEEVGDLSSFDSVYEPLVLVLAGKKGIGKSTLINNLLDLKEEEMAVTSNDINPTTVETKVYNGEIRGVPLKVVDTPGLGIVSGGNGERHNTMAQLTIKTGEKGDVLLYCVCINIGCSIDSTDIEILRLLRWVFGKGLFQHCILVFTMANIRAQLHNGVEMEGRMQTCAVHFHKALQKAGIPDIQVTTIQSNRDDKYKGILAIPAGSDEDDEWKGPLIWEVVRKCNPSATRSLLKIKGYKKAVLMKHLSLTGIMDKCEEYIKDPDVGSTMHLERANTKIDVRRIQKEILSTTTS